MNNFLVKAAAVAAAAITVGVPALAIGQGQPGGAAVTRVAFQQKLAERFAALDANRDGMVTQAEFDARRAAMKAERRNARFAALDANRDGQVSRAEFDAGAHNGRGGRGHGRGHGAGRVGGTGGFGRMSGFAMMDANRDGRVTLAEAIARPLAAFDAADADKDGQVTPEERRAARAQAKANWRAKRG